MPIKTSKLMKRSILFN